MFFPYQVIRTHADIKILSGLQSYQTYIWWHNLHFLALRKLLMLQVCGSINLTCADTVFMHKSYKKCFLTRDEGPIGQLFLYWIKMLTSKENSDVLYLGRMISSC